MKLTLAAVGRLRPEYRALADEYAARVARFMEFSEVEVREASRAPSPAVQLREEAVRLQDKLPAGSRIVVLDRTGKGLSSEALARELDRWRVGGPARDASSSAARMASPPTWCSPPISPGAWVR